MGGGNGGFTRVPNSVTPAVVAAGGTLTDLAVLICLIRYQRDGGTYSVPAKNIAGELGRSEASVCNALSNLVSFGILERVHRGQKGRTASYRLTRAHRLLKKAAPEGRAAEARTEEDDIEAYVERQRREEEASPGADLWRKAGRAIGSGGVEA
jgi:DNA-binding MarR family transcriptional regulator